MSKNLSVLILAGGFGKRIKGVWDSPKGLIPYKGKTILGVILDELGKSEIAQQMVLISNEDHYQDYSNYVNKGGWKIKVVSNGASEGNGRGAIRDMRSGLGELPLGDVMILPCDTVTRDTFQLKDFADFGNKHEDGLSIVVREERKELIANNFGNVILGKDERITSFVEKPQEPISNLAVAAMYYYPQDCVSWISLYEREGENLDNPGRVVPWALEHQRPVYGYLVKTGLVDVGRPESFYEIQGITNPNST